MLLSFLCNLLTLYSTAPLSPCKRRLVRPDMALVTHGPYLSALEIKSLYIKRYINSAVYFTLLFINFLYDDDDVLWCRVALYHKVSSVEKNIKYYSSCHYLQRN